MRLFITILLTMFIGACTGNTNVAEKPAGTQSVQKYEVEASSDKAVEISPELEEAVQKAIKERAPKSVNSETEVPTIVVTPNTEPDVETSVIKVPEKEVQK